MVYFPRQIQREWQLCEKTEWNDHIVSESYQKHLKALKEGPPQNILTAMPVSMKTEERFYSSPFLDIDEPLIDKVTVEALLQKIEVGNTLSEETNVFLDAAGTPQLYRCIRSSYHIPQAPERFILQLKRFEKERESFVKKDFLVYMKEEVQFMKYTYRLNAVIVHSGKLEGGHYYTVRRGERGIWWVANDDAIYPDPGKKIPIETQELVDCEIKKDIVEQDVSMKEVALTKGYLYFYQKVALSEEPVQ
jgi:hypothetical protein